MKKALLLVLVLVAGVLLGGCDIINWLRYGDVGYAHADIVGSTSNDLIIVGSKVKLSEQIEAQDKAKTINIDSGTILAGVATIISKLGTLEGVAYDFEQQEVINQCGATLFTYTNESKPYLNISADLLLLDIAGVGGALDYNLGSVLPVKNIPVIQYFQYLHINSGAGYDFTDKRKRIFAGALFKITF